MASNAMTRLPTTAKGAAEAGPEESVGFVKRFRAILVGDTFVNLAVVCAIAVGFFHGWLKLRFRSPVTTFAFDIFLIVAIVVVMGRAGTLRRFFPAGPTTNALLGFYGLCFAYLLLSFVPGMPPFLVALSTLRGWIFATFLYGLGYQITRNRSQVHGYYLLIIALGLVTAIYGIGQSDAEVLRMMEEDEYFAWRYRGQGYLDSEGDFHVRRFSTFISSGAFGGTMSTTIIFATAIFLASHTPKVERVALAAAMVPIGYAMFLSGARSAAISAGLGVLVLLWFRRKLSLGLGLGLAVAVGTLLAWQATGGGIFDRLQTLTFKNIFYRFWLPTAMGIEYMSTHLLGGGLGKTGFRPGFLWGVSDYDDYLAPDGDLGRLMVEFGLLGLVLFGRVVYHTARSMYAAVKSTLTRPAGALVLAGAVNCWISIAFLGVGSPFVGIPLGVLVWFFVGAGERLAELERTALAAGGAETSTSSGRPRRGSGRETEASARPPGESKPARSFLYGASFRPRLPSSEPSRAAPRTSIVPKDGGPVSRSEESPIPTKSAKVFLFRSSKGEEGTEGRRSMPGKSRVKR